MRFQSFIHAKQLEGLRKKILYHYAQHPVVDAEINEALAHIEKHKLSAFFGDFQKKYNANEVAVHSDSSNGLPYVVADGKKLYFKRSQNKRTIQLLFNGLRTEQDSQCPHCYTDHDFFVEEGDTLADIGCAEGNFTLMNIETLKKAYLFEQDPEWREALEATFAPWKEKVQIIPKYVSDTDSETEVSLDSFFAEKEDRPNFFKIDVEGAEGRVLEGMSGLMLQDKLKMALCTYHNQGDFDAFSRYFAQTDFKFKPNPGVMIFLNDLETLQAPFFRKCLIKAWRQGQKT
jgi:hypothetical protein